MEFYKFLILMNRHRYAAAFKNSADMYVDQEVMQFCDTVMENPAMSYSPFITGILMVICLFPRGVLQSLYYKNGKICRSNSQICSRGRPFLEQIPITYFLATGLGNSMLCGFLSTLGQYVTIDGKVAFCQQAVESTSVA